MNFVDMSLPTIISIGRKNVLAALMLAALSGGRICAQEPAMMLPASAAKVTGNLKIQGEGEAATIHFWNRLEDTMSWTWKDAKPGNYRAALNYSQLRAGGMISLTVGEQQLIAPAEPTKGWSDFQTFELGVVSVGKAGETAVTLQSTQLPTGNGAAMPDVAWLSLTPTDAPATSKPLAHKAIFDGKTLDGWEGDLTWFHVEDGAVVAGSLDKAIPQNEFLCTTREYGNFELRAKVRLVNGKGNGGVQFRSQRVKDSREMSGYQADAAEGCWGGLYDESRRAKFLGIQLNAGQFSKVLKRDGWNAYVIRCEGPRIRIWLNDVLTLDYTELDTTIPQTGYIGLQIHQGEPSEACYKDIDLEELPSSSTLPK